MPKKRSRTSDICGISLFTVLICLCTWLQVPFPIPFTLQTFAVYAALFCLGGRKGTISITVYLIMGAVGLPVFSSFSGGIGSLLGVTGGFLWGFLISGVIYAVLEKVVKNKLMCAFISVIFCYLSGNVWFFTVYSEKSGLGGIIYTLCICVFPFIIPDIIKILLAYYISKRIKQHLPR